MNDQDRREFLKQLAKTAAYTAPVVHSMAAPVELAGQGMASMHKPMKGAVADSQRRASDAPWDRPPPGQ